MSVNAEVKLKRGESQEKLLKRFKKKVSKAGVIKEFLERRYFVKPSEKKRKHKEKVRHLRKKENAKNK